MNKQLTKKTIAIAASAALMAAVALSGSALADPGNGRSKNNVPNKGGASAAVSAWCEIKDENINVGKMTVHVKVEDKSSGDAMGRVKVGAATVRGKTKDGGNNTKLVDIPGALATPNLMMTGTYQEVTINLCGDGGLDGLGKAINALTTITLEPINSSDEIPTSKDEYTAYCADNPYTLDVNEGGLKTADYYNRDDEKELCSDT